MPTSALPVLTAFKTSKGFRLEVKTIFLKAACHDKFFSAKGSLAIVKPANESLEVAATRYEPVAMSVKV